MWLVDYSKYSIGVNEFKRECGRNKTYTHGEIGDSEKDVKWVHTLIKKY